MTTRPNGWEPLPPPLPVATSPAAPALSAGRPEVVGRWNWAAFGLTPIWALCHRIWWLAVVSFICGFVPLVGLPVSIYAGVKGNEWAWEAYRQGDAEAFDRRQRNWSRAGWILLIVIIVVAVLAAALTTGDDRPSQSAAPFPAATADAGSSPVPVPAGWRVERDADRGFALAVPEDWTRVDLSKPGFPASFASFKAAHPESARANQSILRSYLGNASFAVVEPGRDRSAVAVLYGYPDDVNAGAAKQAATTAQSELKRSSGIASVSQPAPAETPAGDGWTVRAETPGGLVLTTTYLQIDNRLVQVDFYMLRSYEQEHRTVQEQLLYSIRRPT